MSSRSIFWFCQQTISKAQWRFTYIWVITLAVVRLEPMPLLWSLFNFFSKKLNFNLFESYKVTKVKTGFESAISDLNVKVLTTTLNRAGPLLLGLILWGRTSEIEFNLAVQCSGCLTRQFVDGDFAYVAQSRLACPSTLSTTQSCFVNKFRLVL